MESAEEKELACPDCGQWVAVHVAGPDTQGPERMVLAFHRAKDGTECAGSELVYVEGAAAVQKALRSAVSKS